MIKASHKIQEPDPTAPRRVKLTLDLDGIADNEDAGDGGTHYARTRTYTLNYVHTYTTM